MSLRQNPRFKVLAFGLHAKKQNNQEEKQEMPKFKPMYICCSYACFIIGNQWRYSRYLPRNR